jgi:pyridoxine 4-dehydrogenase
MLLAPTALLALSTPNAPAAGSVSRRAALGLGASAGIVDLFPSAPASASSSTPLTLPPIGVGAWAWGDSLFWGYDPRKDNELQELFDYVSETPNAFFDTAELYGLGRSETLLGDFERAKGKRVAIASKFAALPWKTSRQEVVKACKASLKRMGRDSMELYQIHFPSPWANAEYWDGLGDCYEQGLVKAVGVSNYGVDAVQAVHDSLASRGIPLFSNQIQYSLLHPFANANGLKQKCDELGVKVLAYSPLGLGLLSGKYSKEKLPSGPRAALATAFFEDAAAPALVDAVRKTADKHGGTPSQVAINWCIAKGTCPIPGARSLRQAQENFGSLEWKLDASDVALLDTACAAVKPLAAKSPFPEKDVKTGLRMFDS